MNRKTRWIVALAVLANSTAALAVEGAPDESYGTLGFAKTSLGSQLDVEPTQINASSTGPGDRTYLTGFITTGDPEIDQASSSG